MRVLLVDNYDSFTYNLLRLLELNWNGARFILRRNRALDLLEIPYDVLVLSAGPSTPDRAGRCLELLRKNLRPVLGVCLGMQIINCHLGGSVRRSRLPLHGRVERVRPGSAPLFRGIRSPFEAARYNSLACRLSPGRARETSRGMKSEEPMSLESPDGLLQGVQFHPESFLSRRGARLVNNFRRMALDMLGK